MILLEVSSTTDWIQAIGVLLGVPTTAYGIFKLFKKDKEQDKKLESLGKIAEQLKDQADQLAAQSGHMQYQSHLMAESNKLLEKQLEIQSDSLGADKEVKEQMLELERKKRLLEIRPFFMVESSMSGPNGFTFDLLNKGGDAKNIAVTEINTDFVQILPIAVKLNVDRGHKFPLRGSIRADKTYFTNNIVTFQVMLTYEDIDGNSYSQIASRLTNGRLIIEDPVLKESST